MEQLSPMQRALGEQWQQLPAALQRHYLAEDNVDVGELDIAFPGFMRPYLWLVHRIGALIHKRGRGITTRVSKQLKGEFQYWRREVRFADGKAVAFNSFWEYTGGNEVIEYVSPLLGLRMAVTVHDGKLFYQGRHLVLRLGAWKLPIAEWLVLGHTTIVEQARDDSRFHMDFRLRHPWFGLLYRYAGTFRTELTDRTPR